MTALWWLIPSALVSGVGIVVLCLCRAAGRVRPLPVEETDQGFSDTDEAGTESTSRSPNSSGSPRGANPAHSNGNPAAGGSEAAPSSGPISQPVSLLRVIQGGKS